MNAQAIVAIGSGIGAQFVHCCFCNECLGLIVDHIHADSLEAYTVHFTFEIGEIAGKAGSCQALPLAIGLAGLCRIVGSAGITGGAGRGRHIGATRLCRVSRLYIRLATGTDHTDNNSQYQDQRDEFFSFQVDLPPLVLYSTPHCITGTRTTGSTLCCPRSGSRNHRRS